MSKRKSPYPSRFPIIIRGLFLVLTAAVFVSGCHLPAKVDPEEVVIQPVMTATPTDVPVPTETPVPTAVPTPTPVLIDAADYFLGDTDQERYAGWIRKLSGDEPVSIGGQEYTITTRYSYAMFTGQDNAKASEYLLEQLAQWVSPDMITFEPYEYRDAMPSRAPSPRMNRSFTPRTMTAAWR